MSSRELRIAIAAETIPYIQGGLGYFVLNAIQRLALANPTWKFYIIATSSFKELSNLSLPNIEIIFWDRKLPQRVTEQFVRHFLPFIPSTEASYKVGELIPFDWARAQWGNLQALWKSLRVNAIWVPHYSITKKHLSLSKNLSGVCAPILFTIHDIHPVFYKEDWPQVQLDRFWNEFTPFAHRCNTIITHSQYQRTSIIEWIRIDPDRVLTATIPPLMDPNNSLQVMDAAPRESALCKFAIRTPFLFYPASTMATHKNHNRLLLAWGRLKQQLGEECPALVCTSKNHLWPAYRSLIVALGLEREVIFTDLIETEALSELLQTCSGVIVPTLYEGGGSDIVSAACLAGKPVISAQIPQIEEQMRAFGCKVEFFDPTSVEAIYKAILNAFNNMPSLQIQAEQNQRELRARIDSLWEKWVMFYSSMIQHLAKA